MSDAVPEYFDVTLEEGNVLNDLAALLQQYGWTHERYFKKTAFSAHFINPESTLDPDSRITFSVAEHIILKHPNPDVQVLYGFALHGQFSEYYGMLPDHLKPMNNVKPPKQIESAQVYESDDDFADLAEWVTNRYPPSRQNHTIYMYMLNMTTADLSENGEKDLCIAWEGGDLKRAVLDVEVHRTAYYMLAGSPIFRITKALDSYKQSPITQMSLRVPAADVVDDQLSSLTPYVSTNWHNDSLIRVRGITNGDVPEHYIYLMLQADSSGAYEDNITPMIPLFVGKFIPNDPEDKWNFALSAGSAFKTNTPEFDFDNPAAMIPSLHPLLKTYTMRPGNGVDQIMVYRNKYGAYYQSHYITASAPSNIMPPILTHDKRDYPRAWNRPESHVHNYQYNPGVYTDEVASSNALITHIDEGIRGEFPHLVVTLPLHMNNGDRLKHRVETCDNVYDYYRFFLPEAVSPFTKIPGVAYRQMGIGLLYKRETEVKPTE